MERYRAVGRAVGRDGVVTVAIAKHTVDADAFVAELNRLLYERDEAREEVRLLREEVAIADRGAEHPDAAAWRSQVGTWCGVLDDGTLVAQVPLDGECPDGWEWDDARNVHWEGDALVAAPDWNDEDSEARFAPVRRIPAPPVEVGQWRQWPDEAPMRVCAIDGNSLWIGWIDPLGDRCHDTCTLDEWRGWPLCDPDPRWETTEREARHG